jgi:hypothetical protein
MFQRQDVLGGLLLVGLGVAGLVFGAPLAIGTPRRMGPGFFPMILSWLLIGLGGVVAIGGAVRAGATASRIAWRPLILITVAVGAFGALIDRTGLLLATVAVVALSAFAGRDARPAEVAALAVTMAVCTAVLFVYALGQPLPLWGR